MNAITAAMVVIIADSIADSNADSNVVAITIVDVDEIDLNYQINGDALTFTSVHFLCFLHQLMLVISCVFTLRKLPSSRHVFLQLI